MNKDLKVGLILLVAGVFTPVFIPLKDFQQLPLIFIGAILIGRYVGSKNNE